MNQKTKVVLSGSGSKHKSHLVKALQAINLKDFSQTPSGVWGSEATIKCGDVTIKSSELDFEFVIPFDDNLEANEGEIIVYNLSDKTILSLHANDSLSVEAGYKGDTGVIFKGFLKKKHTHREGADRITTLKIIDDIGKKESINLSFSSGTKASYILEELLKKTGLPIAKFRVARDWTYDKDVTIDETLESAIKTYSEVCGISTFTRHGSIYSCALSYVPNDGVFNVNTETGMIGSPSPFEETTTAENYSDTKKGYEVEMLLQHRMAAGALINLTSDIYKGKCYVKSGEHRFNESECITTVKAVW